MRPCVSRILLLTAGVLYGGADVTGAEEPDVREFEGWTAVAPREEIRPQFLALPQGGPDGEPALAIAADQRPGLSGSWIRTFPVEGGRTYRLYCLRRTEQIRTPRRTAVVRLLWQDAAGRRIQRDEPTFPSYRPGDVPMAEPEYVAEQSGGSASAAAAEDSAADGWIPVTAVLAAPKAAAQVLVELHYLWEPDGRVTWTVPTFTATDPVPPRRARLATVHFCPHAGKTPREKCEQFAPLIAEAAAQRADLVVLPETLTYYGTGLDFVDVAESIPGPSTQYFGELARQHDLYLVVGLVERDAHLIYNVAVLIGPDGQVVGKYRKVTLPRGEIEAGLTPGDEYPVFDTRFGKVGMMVCYDGFFPEVARELSNAGAEVIAWPVWGCNPLLAQARACENHVWLISSTYTDVSAKWMVSAIFDQAGQIAAQAEKFGTVAVQEVDLSRPLYWQSLGDFRAQIEHHRPVDAAGR